MFETGMRAGEVVLELPDLDLANGNATVRRGKGGKGRLVPFGPDASLAIDRYLRLRRGHRLADSPAVWSRDDRCCSGETHRVRRHSGQQHSRG